MRQRDALAREADRDNRSREVFVAARPLRRRAAPARPGIDESRTRIYYWWLLLALFFEYVRPGAFVPVINAIKLGTIIPGALFVVTFFAPGLRPWNEIFSDRYVKWLVAFIVLIAISVPFATVTMYAYNVLTNVLTQFTLFMMIARIATSLARLRGIFATLIAAHVAIVLLNPALVLTPEVRSYIRGAPFLGDGNDFGLSVSILIPMAVEIARHARSRFVTVLAWTSLAAMLLAVIGTQSRGASLAVAAVFIFLWRYSTRKFASFVVIAFVGLAVMVVASDSYLNRMGTIANYEQDGSAEGRLDAWGASIRMAIDHPVTGVGAGQFPMEFGRHYRGGLYAGRWLTAHSMYFLVLGELGVTGVVALIALVIGSPLALLSLRRRVLAAPDVPSPEWRQESERFLCTLAAGCIGFAVAGAFLSVAYYPHVFVLTAVTASARLVIGSGLARQDATVRAANPKVSTRAGNRVGKRRRNFTPDPSAH